MPSNISSNIQSLYYDNSYRDYPTTKVVGEFVSQLAKKPKSKRIDINTNKISDSKYELPTKVTKA